jgi:DNA-binding NtrC family response regulator
MIVRDHRKKILIVDDDTRILQTLKSILQLRGFIVQTAQTRAEAIQKSQAQRYNLALLDIRLPDMEGTELLTQTSLGTPQMGTTIISDYLSLENTVGSPSLGADAYLVKPIDPSNLLKIAKDKLHEQEVEGYRTVLPEDYNSP